MSDNVGSAKAEENKGETPRKNSGRRSQKGKQTEPSLNMSELRELAELVDQHGFTDFEFENENIRIRLSKNPAPQILQSFQPMASQAPMGMAAPAPTQSGETAASSAESAPAESDSDAGLHKITSPIVGTFYRAPAPDKEPYVKEGSQVTPESIVCIVEAMKLMNEIQAEVSGEVVKIYVENGQPVEYGQPLFGIKQ